MDDPLDTRVPSNGLPKIPYDQRVLQLPHCLRPSQNCPGRLTKHGLDCTGCGRIDCAIFQLRSAALEAGYGGICVAPGGRLAARFVSEHEPAGIVAVACHKELEEGFDAVAKMGYSGRPPAAAVVPLSRDGCVDTDVDVVAAKAAILNYTPDK